MDLEDYISKLLLESDKIPTRYVYKVEIKFADGSKSIYPGDSFLVNSISKRVSKTEFLPEYTVVSYRMLIDVDQLIEDADDIYNELMRKMQIKD